MTIDYKVPHEFAETYMILGNLITRVSAAMRIQADISDNNLLDVVKRYEHDMERMSKDQGPSIAPQKRIGVLVFWIRRLKPIHMAKPVGKSDIRTEIQDINEQIAIRIATLLILEAAESGDGQCAILSSIQAENRVPEFEDFITHHWSTNSYMNYVHLVYSLRYRNCSHHYIAQILDSIVTGFAYQFRPARAAAANSRPIRGRA